MYVIEFSEVIAYSLIKISVN